MALTTVQSGLLGSDAQALSFRNRIINGDMRIDQRGAGSAGFNITAGTKAFAIDRFFGWASQSAKLSVQQVTDAPTGFRNSLKVTTVSAYTPTAGEEFNFYHSIEGNNIADLGWGTSNAVPATLSFWVKSSLTGTFSGALRAGGGSMASFVFTYTVAAANTWQYITINLPAVTIGTFPTDNTGGVGITWSLGIGSNFQTSSVNTWTTDNKMQATGAVTLVTNASATWQITGVQLEKGTTATPFENRPYGMELTLCQRYFYMHASGSGQQVGTGYYYASGNDPVAVHFKVPMRIAPSIYASSGTGYFITYSAGTSTAPSSVSIDPSVSPNACLVKAGSAGTVGYGLELRTANAAAYIGFNAEL